MSHAASGNSLHSEPSTGIPWELVALVQRLAMARGLDEIMAVVRSQARSLIGADGITFVLRDAGQCYYADEDAISPLWKGQRFPLQACISGWAMLNRQAVVIPDIYSDPRIPHDAYRRTFVKSLVMVPVRKEDPVGAIGAYWADQHTPAPGKVALLTTIANSAAVAMTNVGLTASLVAAKEEAEQQAVSARSAARAKQLFLANMSHELRTPLNAVLGFAEMLDTVDDATALQRRADYLKAIRTAGSHLMDLLDTILEMARLEEGTTELSLQALSAQDMVGDACSMVDPLAREAGVGITVRPSPSLPTMRGDLRATRQILINLLGNAIKFSPSGSHVEVLTRSHGQWVEIAITDRGIGMNAEEIARVREPFVQAARERNQFHQGAGLGLSIADALAGEQGGALGIESREGAGTTVTLWLPQWGET